MAHKLVNAVFLMCSERSGSNLVTKVFDAHPDFVAPGTAHVFRAVAEMLPVLGTDPARLREAIQRLFEAKVSSWLLDEHGPDHLRAVLGKEETAADMVAAIFLREMTLAGKPRAFVKENSIYRYLPLLEAASLEPSYLFMVRDPRDMALSWLNAPVLRGGVVRAAKRWASDQEGYLSAFHWLRQYRKVSFLTYESLVSAPEKTLRRVCAELGIKYSEAMLQFNDLSRSGKADAARTGMWANLASPMMTQNFNKFSGGLEADQVRYIEATCGRLMSALGYETATPSELMPLPESEEARLLEAELSQREPWEKEAYASLPAEERRRFQNWSRVHAALTRAPLAAVDG